MKMQGNTQQIRRQSLHLYCRQRFFVLVMIFTVIMVNAIAVVGLLNNSGGACFISNRSIAGIRKRVNSSCSFTTNNVSTSTQLYMGIRSFLRKNILNKNNGDDNEQSSENPRTMVLGIDLPTGTTDDNPSDVRAALQAIKEDLEAVEELETKKQQQEQDDVTTSSISRSSSSTVESRTVDSSDTKSLKIRPPPMFREAAMGITDTYGETVNERIQRVKSGSMTDEEKAQFLNTALSRRTLGSLKDSSKPKGPPIRQAIPNADSGSSTFISSSTSKNSSATSTVPSSKDPLWNTVMGKRSSSSNTSSHEYGVSARESLISGKLNDDSAKREYLEMVMNPNRFKQYAALSANDNIDYEAEEEENDVLSEKDAAKSSEVSKNEVGQNDTKDIITNNDPTTKQTQTTLASRLEEAATIQEQRDAELKLRKDAERKAEEEEQKKQIERMRILQEERIAVKRQEEELLRQKEQEIEAEKEKERKAKQEAEKKRMEEVVARQDEYWKKKLAKEQSRKSRMMSTSNNEQSTTQSKESRMKALQQLEIAKIAEKNKLRKQEVDDFEEEVKSDSMPKKDDENNAVKDDMKFDSRIQSPPSLSFIKEQARKKAALDKLMKSQKDRLASLNSPLPKMGESQPTVIPKYSSPTRPMSSTENVTATGSKSISPATTLDSRLSLNELTKKKKKQPSPDTYATTSVTATSKKTSNDPPQLSLSQMTMLKRDQPSKRTTTTINSKSSSGSKKNKGPIRQRVLLDEDDDDDDDFFVYSRSGSNKNLSIKDIMAQKEKNDNSESSTKSTKTIDAKEKSRMWGIDIDKFN